MSTYTQEYLNNACFNAVQLACVVGEHSETVSMSTKIRHVAMGIADAERTDGFVWGVRAEYDEVIDRLAKDLRNTLNAPAIAPTRSALRGHAYNTTMAAAAFGVLHKD